MKTTALILLLSGFSVLAQSTPPAAGTASGDQALRDMLRRTINGQTNVPAPAPKPAKAQPKVQPAPPPEPVVTNTAPAADAAYLPVPAAAEDVAADSVPTASPSVAATPEPVASPIPAMPTEAPIAPKPTTPRKAARRMTNSAPTLAAAPVKPAPAQEDMIAAGQINFSAAELNLVLNLYAELVNRTILRAPGLPAPTIALKTQTPLTRKEAIEAIEAVLALNGVTMINIGEKFVKAVPVAQADTAGAELGRGDGDNIPEMGQHVTQIVQLKYAKPSEVTPTLQLFGNTKSIVPVDSSGIIVIRDYAENVKRMLEMIKEIDVTPQTEMISEVIPIKYALAADISSAISAVSGQGSSVTSVGGAAAGASRPATGGAGARTTGTTGLAGRTTTGNNGYQAGRTTGQGGQATPNGTPSSTASFSDRLRSIVNRAGSSGGDVQILGQTKIIPDERTNSLLIFATRGDMETIKDIISKLDVVLAQVLIEALIMEVSLDSSRDLGVSYLAHQKTFDKSSAVGAVNNVPFLNAGNFVSGVSNAVASVPSGFSYFGTWNNDLDITATAIAGDSRVNVLSRPSIQTSHAVTATLFIGDTRPYITGTTYGDFAGSTSRSVYEEKEVGISLEVTPLINPDGLVVMDITQDIEQLGTPTQIDGNDVPTTTKRTAQAKVAVKDRDTVILGGFISTTKTSSHSGVPLLKDIPLLGYLFRSSSDSGKRVELIVMMRPTVLPTPEAAARLAVERKNALPGVRQAEAEQNKEEERLQRKADRKMGPAPVYNDTPETK